MRDFNIPVNVLHLPKVTPCEGYSEQHCNFECKYFSKLAVFYRVLKIWIVLGKKLVSPCPGAHAYT